MIGPDDVDPRIDELHTLVINDAGLYDMMQAATGSLGEDLGPEYEWVEKNRRLCEEVEGNVASGRKRQHYLKYG